MEGTIIVARYKETNKILTSEIKSGILVSLRFFNGFVLPSAQNHSHKRALLQLQIRRTKRSPTLLEMKAHPWLYNSSIHRLVSLVTL